TGFGHTESELRDRAAFTPIVEAMAGALIYTSRHRPPSSAGAPDGALPPGARPRSSAGSPVGDIFPAALAGGAIGLALYRRERDGLGARVDMAMYDAMIAIKERAVGKSGMF